MKANNILATIGNTPHVRINRLFGAGANVWVKSERSNPGGSVKDRIALAMIEDAEKSGALNQANAGVARGGLDDGAAGLQGPRLFGGFDHGQRDAVLDRAARVAAFGFDPDICARAKQALDAHMGRVADGVEDGVGFHERFLSRWCVGAAPSRRMWAN